MGVARCIFACYTIPNEVEHYEKTSVDLNCNTCFECLRANKRK